LSFACLQISAIDVPALYFPICDFDLIDDKDVGFAVTSEVRIEDAKAG